MLGRDLDDAQEWVRSWAAGISERAEASARLADRVAAITATATSADGAIRVSVAGSGVMNGLELDDRVHRLSGVDLADEILRVMRRAQSMLTEQVTAAVADTVGVDTESGRAVIDSFTQRFPPEPPQGGSGRAVS